MPCPNCHTENPAGAQFCGACGAALTATCAHCGHDNPQGARFCNQCGSALQPGKTPTAAEPPAGTRGYTPRHLRERVLTSRSALEGERKRVTVLFADIKGSTELAGQLDDEAWHAILDRFFDILTRGVHRYEGTVNQYTGDGIMALFGAPVAHEDHALRACLAALDVQRELRAYADQLRVTRGLNLSARIGLNSGEVVVGKIGDDLRMDYTAQGQTVHLAARMEQIAEAGRICLTRYTAQLVEGYFRLRDLGAMPVKGVAEPVAVYELEGPGALRTRLERSAARGLSRFVGRERELQILAEAQATAAAGSGSCIAVAGEAGIGKSRLCHEHASRCRARELPVYSGFAVPYATALPMHPVLTLARSLFDIDEREAPARQRQRIAGALALAGVDDPDALPLLLDALDVAEAGAAPPAVDPEHCRERFFDLLIRLLLAGEEGRLLLLEDLHWADAPSLDFVARLVRALEGSHALLLVNYRPWAAPAWLAAIRTLPLEALSAAEIGELLHDLLGQAPELQPLGQRLCRQGAGNPLFVEEAVRSLAEQGYLRGAPGAYAIAGEIPETVLPDSVQGILAARIDRLDEAAKNALAHAAVIGKRFDRRRLGQLLEADPQPPSEPVDASLDRLVAAGFLAPEDDIGDFRFSHPLTQEVAYRSQLGARRAAIHGRLAALLESELRPGALDERALLLAHHWRRAGEPLKAAQWTLEAARTEVMTRESSSAMERFQAAVALADEAPAGEARDRLAARARAGVVRTASLLSAPAEATARAFHEGLALAEGLGDESTRAELLIAHGALSLQQGDADRAVAEMRQALDIAYRIGEPELGARFRIPVLLAYFCSGRIQEGIDVLNAPGKPPWFDGSVNEENFLSRAFRGLMLTWLGRLPEAREELRQAIAVETRIDRSVSWMHANLSEVARLGGEADVALREARRAVARAEPVGGPFFRAFAWRTLAMAHGAAGDWQEARRVLEAHGPAFGRGQAAHQFEALYLANLAETLLMLGDVRQARSLGEQALASAEASHSRTWACQARWVLACLYARDGDPAAAEAQLEALAALVAETGARIFEPLALQVRAEIGSAEARRQSLAAAAERWRAMGAPARADALLALHPATAAPRRPRNEAR